MNPESAPLDDLKKAESRTLSDANLIKGGAEFVRDSGSEGPRLELTKKQIGKLEVEMEHEVQLKKLETFAQADLWAVGKQEIFTSESSALDALEHLFSISRTSKTYVMGRKPIKTPEQIIKNPEVEYEPVDVWEHSIDKDWVAEGLAGLDSDRAWQIRERLLADPAQDFTGTMAVAKGLAGVDSERAWQLRERILADEKHIHYQSSLAEGLAGLDSERAWQFRERLRAIGGTAESSLVEGVAGIDSERAWQLRERLLNTEMSKGYIALSLAGLDSERTWQLRERLLSEGVSSIDLGPSLAGLDSERAWQFRERLLAQEHPHKDRIAEGLAGVDSERAWKLRVDLLAEGVWPDKIAKGLAGLGSKRAREFRDYLLAEGARVGAVAQGIVGDHLTFVWRLRRDGQK